MQLRRAIMTLVRPVDRVWERRETFLDLLENFVSTMDSGVDLAYIYIHIKSFMLETFTKYRDLCSSDAASCKADWTLELWTTRYRSEFRPSTCQSPAFPFTWPQSHNVEGDNPHRTVPSPRQGTNGGCSVQVFLFYC
jgi:hypothetical protein